MSVVLLCSVFVSHLLFMFLSFYMLVYCNKQNFLFYMQYEINVL